MDNILLLSQMFHVEQTPRISGYYEIIAGIQADQQRLELDLHFRFRFVGRHFNDYLLIVLRIHCDPERQKQSYLKNCIISSAWNLNIEQTYPSIGTILSTRASLTTKRGLIGVFSFTVRWSVLALREFSTKVNSTLVFVFTIVASTESLFTATESGRTSNGDSPLGSSRLRLKTKDKRLRWDLSRHGELNSCWETYLQNELWSHVLNLLRSTAFER